MRNRGALLIIAGAIVLGGCAGASSTETSAGPRVTSTSAAGPTAGVPTAVADDVTGLPPAGVLEPGRYRIGAPFPVAFDVEFADEGWSGAAADDCCLLISHRGAQPPGLLFFAAWTIDGLYANPCRHVPADAVGPTVGDLAAALRSIPAYGAGEPVATTVGGRPSIRLRLSISPDVDIAACDDAEYWMWQSGGQNTRYAPPGYAAEEEAIWIVDADGTRIVIDGIFSEATDDDRRLMEAMVASISFASTP
jgi:hypothetical protein